MREHYGENKRNILMAGRALIAQKGYSSVGLSEILAAAAIPKGSFYHYFGSKEQYGRELIEHYVAGYLESLERVLGDPAHGASARERLLTYWGYWLESQCCQELEQRCLVVKLSAEVADLSEDMRQALHQGTQAFIERIAACIAQGIAEGSLHTVLHPLATATMLYQQWLGASLLSRLSRDRAPMEAAMLVTRRVLVLPEAG
ncbi:MULTISPECIES: TetR/AcrR family transcriptional regulator [Herbaspirillum]|uniref:Transcription regulator protein n=1 Tax=Herbaspirillum seropedicae (strain SmR1) TaxID=757424 RepID=D8IRD7_HERSS|nr:MULTISPECIES: TetR/AcrR family transcriptional regulator [Herbaspirillum]ADJ65263.1 transcription regulator protein [Herbaspirillum seropedicae SmR1]AKN67115.1 TetR family transcriptional regulator [Herbaspirillum seropedicae]AON56163.1 transcription regulator protein [Herbaspirillum seropedicae]NQE30284.1 TetR family transcriptional regulator [Herbaspirillum seropedicae]UMU23120.1 TetR/AcrR family transcriptional regulator [Herbaspirillum seropedicae]